MEVDGHARSGSVNVPFFSSFFFGAVPGRPLRPFEADGAAVSSLTRSASLRCVTSASSSSSSSSFGFSWVLPFLCARSPWRPTTICRRNRVGVSRTSKCSSITSRYEEERKLGNQRQNPKPNKKKLGNTHTRTLVNETRGRVIDSQKRPAAVAMATKLVGPSIPSVPGSFPGLLVAESGTSLADVPLVRLSFLFLFSTERSMTVAATGANGRIAK